MLTVFGFILAWYITGLIIMFVAFFLLSPEDDLTGEVLRSMMIAAIAGPIVLPIVIIGALREWFEQNKNTILVKGRSKKHKGGYFKSKDSPQR